MKIRLQILLCLISFLPLTGMGQITLGDDLEAVDYADPRLFEIGGITVSGIQFLDNAALISISGLVVGDKIKVPGEFITKAVRKLWDQGLFETVSITATRIQGDKIFLDIGLKERPRLSKFTFAGIRKGEADKIRDEIKLQTGDLITENVLLRTRNSINSFFLKKGYLNADCEIIQKKDTSRDNAVILFINITKNSKVRIANINITGNSVLTDEAIRRTLKETKEKNVIRPFHFLDAVITGLPRYVVRLDPAGYAGHVENSFQACIKPRIFKASRLIRDDYEADKLKIIDKYNELGYRDAHLVSDTVYPVASNSVNVDIRIEEGRKYYFREIKWVGNTKYPNRVLDEILKIRKGDVYNQKILETNLSGNPDGLDVSSLYLDDGYLFFYVDPIEVRVESDSIDLEIRIREGKQARINKVSVKGNTKTNDHVIIREMRTRPGQLFSRSDIIRTVRELAQLRYFDQEKLNPVPRPNPNDGTVDIEYQVEETSSDQIELSGGWGYGRVVGTLGLSFNNFSLKKVLDRSAWKPIPSGDGQKLSVRLNSYGKGYLSYNISFTEPWMGGKKPNAFSVSYFHSLYSNGLPKSDTSRSSFVINGVVLGLSKRLQWPDDYFALYHSVSLQRYDLKNYSQILAFSDGYSHNLSYSLTLSRNSIDAPIFPRSGSEISMSFQLTPPYSWFNDKDYKTLAANEKYRFIEYHKYKFSMAFYTKVYGNFVLMSRARYGFLAAFNKDIGVTPFERFYLGGDGLSGYSSLDGREVIGMRGYANESLTPDYYKSRSTGGTIFNKLTMELRYPISLNPNSTIYMMGFFEAGNAWAEFKQFSPFVLKSSAGIGIRVFLPMFGVLGLDWGYGFDEIPGVPGVNKGQFHFSINQSID